MTSSPGLMSSNSAAISSAAVQEWVSNARREPVCVSSHSLQRLVKGPSPARWAFSCACRMYSSSLPVMKGRLKPILFAMGFLVQPSGLRGFDNAVGIRYPPLVFHENLELVEML